ncbi:histone-lysine N-methyltransferase ASHH3-like [Olea europaea var. sylvestris]|uniref:histone-lysine N-methyltransferase ASHH3-like n=1 Tax=Olea europaea var. sylvestris TaxID=158386 RepID=UPI000C1CF5C1|nr:histone-lysine N-methyltransferase ASHH3-like [Olea europaea var. sylvestris]
MHLKSNFLAFMLYLHFVYVTSIMGAVLFCKYLINWWRRLEVQLTLNFLNGYINGNLHPTPLSGAMYILRRRLKGARRMMASFVHAAHRLDHPGFVAEIASVGDYTLLCMLIFFGWYHHCFMLRSSCSSACNCGISCVNKPFHQRPVKKMKTVKTEKCGLGVVAEEDINQGDFVIEYVGEVIDDKTCEDRLWKMKHRGETNFYLCEINRDMVIDATYKGNKSRYINHSCCPNTEMQKWMIDGETRIGIFATRDIVKGEHLTYDYQFVQFGADQDCFCGAIGCRKKLGVKPNKLKLPTSDAALKIVACQVAANFPKVKAALSGKHVHSNGFPAVGGLDCKSVSRRKPRNCIGSVIRILYSLDQRSFGIIKRFDKATRRHLIMFEDGSSDLLNLSKEEWEFCNN